MYAGRILKKLRQDLGFNQDDMALQIGVSQSYYSSIERGKKQISKKLMEKIIRKWNLSSSFFETEKGGVSEKNIGGFNGGILGGYESSNNDVADLDEWNLHRSINAGGNDPHTKIPFYLSRHISKKLILDIINRKDEISNLDNYKTTISAFQYIIENIDFYYFKPVNEAQNEMYKFYDGKNFDYEGYYNSVISELQKLLKFKPAFDKLATAINEFYEEMKDIDEHNIVNGFFGIDKN